MNAYVDTLAEWYENADHAAFRKGDMLIARHDDKPVSYEVYPARCDHDVPAQNVRILSRAPKPTPAWHNAVAVIAHVDDFRGAQRRVFVRRTADFGGICWEDEFSEWPPDDLIDPVPLIEAKVTAEMIDRILDVVAAEIGPYPAGIGETLAVAALGLETA